MVTFSQNTNTPHNITLTPQGANVTLPLPHVYSLLIRKRLIAVKRVGILYHPMIEAAYILAKELQEF